VNNVLRFPRLGEGLQRPLASRHHLGAALLAEPPARSHTVQFYESEEFLLDTVAHFFAAGLEAGDTILAIGSPERRAGVLHRLGALGRRGGGGGGGGGGDEQLTMLDARATLSRLMERGIPDDAAFEDVILDRLAHLRRVRPQRPIRVWGEMVELLCDDDRRDAAIRLEEIWHAATERSDFILLCSYRIDCFHQAASAEGMLDVCARHSHVLPTESFVQLEERDARLREVTLLQQRARSLARVIAERRELESALESALSSQRRAEDELEAARASERDARARAEAADAASEGLAGVARLVHDVVPIVVEAVAEARAAHPGRLIVLRTGEPTKARIDPHRLGRAVASLLANAATHGDGHGPITVAVGGDDEVVSISVRDHGAPLEPEAIARLFDGSSLDLYVAERIVAAYGGRIEVRSWPSGGRRLEILLVREG
jgi:hypothetical protein